VDVVLRSVLVGALAGAVAGVLAAVTYILRDSTIQQLDSFLLFCLIGFPVGLVLGAVAGLLSGVVLAVLRPLLAGGRLRASFAAAIVCGAVLACYGAVFHLAVPDLDLPTFVLTPFVVAVLAGAWWGPGLVDGNAGAQS
jgi:hypothetical protein